MNTVTSLCFGILAAAAVLGLARALRPGSSLADRIVAVDLLLVILVAATAVVTARRDDSRRLGARLPRHGHCGALHRAEGCMNSFEILSSAFMIAGSLLALLGALGLHRFPDVFARMHAATKPATLGLILVLVGAALAVRELNVAATVFLVAALQFITAPVGAHMVGRAAYRAGTELSPDTVVDEWADAIAAEGDDAR
jgi:multicomponent Na+:H+ antiporter subunit G